MVYTLQFFIFFGFCFWELRTKLGKKRRFQVKHVVAEINLRTVQLLYSKLLLSKLTKYVLFYATIFFFFLNQNSSVACLYISPINISTYRSSDPLLKGNISRQPSFTCGRLVFTCPIAKSVKSGYYKKTKDIFLKNIYFVK